MKHCNCCGNTINEGDESFTFEDGTLFCGACYDDFCTYCIEDSGEEVIFE